MTKLEPGVILRNPFRGDTMRSFLALVLSSEAKLALTGLQRQLRAGRLVPEENLHVTLVFLGDQDERTLEILHEELATIPVPQIGISFRGTGCFGGSSPKAVYANVEPNEALSRLHRSIQSAVRRAGITLKRRKFLPHTTLARLKPQDAWAMEPFLATTGGVLINGGEVSEFSLFESILRPDGAEYHELARYPEV